jgi:hypothetical protein
VSGVEGGGDGFLSVDILGNWQFAWSSAKAGTCKVNRLVYAGNASKGAQLNQAVIVRENRAPAPMMCAMPEKQGPRSAKEAAL